MNSDQRPVTPVNPLDMRIDERSTVLIATSNFFRNK